MTPVEIAACFPVMVQLRQHVQADTFVDQIQTLMSHGYQLSFLAEADEVLVVAGFKIDYALYAGKHL